MASLGSTKETFLRQLQRVAMSQMMARCGSARLSRLLCYPNGQALLFGKAWRHVLRPCFADHQVLVGVLPRIKAAIVVYPDTARACCCCIATSLCQDA